MGILKQRESIPNLQKRKQPKFERKSQRTEDALLESLKQSEWHVKRVSEEQLRAYKYKVHVHANHVEQGTSLYDYFLFLFLTEKISEDVRKIVFSVIQHQQQIEFVTLPEKGLYIISNQPIKRYETSVPRIIKPRS